MQIEVKFLSNSDEFIILRSRSKRFLGRTRMTKIWSNCFWSIIGKKINGRVFQKPWAYKSFASQLTSRIDSMLWSGEAWGGSTTRLADKLVPNRLEFWNLQRFLPLLRNPPTKTRRNWFKLYIRWLKALLSKKNLQNKDKNFLTFLRELWTFLKRLHLQMDKKRTNLYRLKIFQKENTQKKHVLAKLTFQTKMISNLLQKPFILANS